MRPLKGVVTRASSRALVIRLESGKLVEGPNEYKLGKFSRVVVRYDYTENRVLEVLPYDPEQEAKEMPVLESEQAMPVDEEENEDHLEALTLDDSGALYLDGDGYWDPESGLLASEFDEDL